MLFVTGTSEFRSLLGTFKDDVINQPVISVWTVSYKAHLCLLLSSIWGIQSVSQFL